jgi:hypothetical protein
MFGTAALEDSVIPEIRRDILRAELAPSRFPIVGSRWVASNGNERLIHGVLVVRFSTCERTQLPVFELLSRGWLFRLFIDIGGELVRSNPALVLHDDRPFPMEYKIQQFPESWT